MQSGDAVSAEDAQVLLQEAHLLKKEGASDSEIVRFANDLIELCEASVATGNPIVF
jgi:hypothetical protein